jgi:hypothetical protein
MRNRKRNPRPAGEQAVILTIAFEASPAVLNAVVDGFCRGTGWNENQLNAAGQPLTRLAHAEKQILAFVLAEARKYRVATAAATAAAAEGATVDTAAATVTATATQT